MSKIVRKTFDEVKKAPISRARLAEISAMPDDEIDFSDIPELTEKFWQNAVPNPFYKPVKKQITLRIDADILVWLRRQGKDGYQSRLNAVLRQVMLQDLRGKRKRA
jgi:uncharacterized protein (DUF4415 family)